jgi:hypothetical protein
MVHTMEIILLKINQWVFFETEAQLKFFNITNGLLVVINTECVSS